VVYISGCARCILTCLTPISLQLLPVVRISTPVLQTFSHTYPIAAMNQTICVILARSTYRPIQPERRPLYFTHVLLPAGLPAGHIAKLSACYMCCTRLAGNAGPKKIATNSPTGHHRTTLSGYIFATKAHIDNWKNLFQWLTHMSS